MGFLSGDKKEEKHTTQTFVINTECPIIGVNNMEEPEKKSISDLLGIWQAVDPKDEDRVKTFGLQQEELNDLGEEEEEYDPEEEDLSTENTGLSD